MEKEKFEKANQLNDKIRNNNIKISTINSLLKANELSCGISGKSPSFFRGKLEYFSSNESFIRMLLEDDKIKFEKENELLIKEFNEL